LSGVRPERLSEALASIAELVKEPRFAFGEAAFLGRRRRYHLSCHRYALALA
jgi:hypothetical protein